MPVFVRYEAVLQNKLREQFFGPPTKKIMPLNLHVSTDTSKAMRQRCSYFFIVTTRTKSKCM